MRIVIPAAAGGTLDIIARTLAPGMSEGFGQVVVVENRATASTPVAEEYVARATPDGHTMFMAGTSRATNPHLYTKLSYDPLRDIASVSLVATSGNALVVGPATPAKYPFERRTSGYVRTSMGSGAVKRVVAMATGERPVIMEDREGWHCGQVT